MAAKWQVQRWGGIGTVIRPEIDHTDDGSQAYQESKEVFEAEGWEWEASPYTHPNWSISQKVLYERRLMEAGKHFEYVSSLIERCGGEGTRQTIADMFK